MSTSCRAFNLFSLYMERATQILKTFLKRDLGIFIVCNNVHKTLSFLWVKANDERDHARCTSLLGVSPQGMWWWSAGTKESFHWQDSSNGTLECRIPLAHVGTSLAHRGGTQIPKGTLSSVVHLRLGEPSCGDPLFSLAETHGTASTWVLSEKNLKITIYSPTPPQYTFLTT